MRRLQKATHLRIATEIRLQALPTRVPEQSTGFQRERWALSFRGGAAGQNKAVPRRKIHMLPSSEAGDTKAGLVAQEKK